MLRQIFTFISILSLLIFHGVALAKTEEKDAAAPSDVEALQAGSGRYSVTLDWSVTWDNIGVTGYKIYYGTHSVNNDNKNRYPVVVDAGNVIEHTITGLLPKKPYYFAVTAYDAAGNESFYYSPEVISIPTGDISDQKDIELLSAAAVVAKADSTTGDDSEDNATLEDLISNLEEDSSESSESDNEAPIVNSALAIDNTHVRVQFSKEVTLPAKDPESAFIAQDNLTLDNLSILSVIYDEEDGSGATVLLETDPQIPDTEYVLTVSSDLEDVSGNPIISGTSDTALFTGSNTTIVKTKEVDGDGQDETEGNKEDGIAEAFSAPSPTLKLLTIEVVNDSSFKATFSEPIVLSLDPPENFNIVLDSNPGEKLEITGVTVSDDSKVITFTTALQTDEFYSLLVSGVTDTNGAKLDHNNNSFQFQGGGQPIADTTPPEDVTNLTGKALDSARALLHWTASLNTAGDLAEYIVYQSTDGKTFGKPAALPKSALKQTIEGLSPGDYYFRVSAKDASGNESDGIVVGVKLVETGPGIGILALLSIGIWRKLGRKRASHS